MDIEYNPFSLKDKTILVTGASSGIGRGIAVACSKMGADVIVSGRNEIRLDDILCDPEGDTYRKVTLMQRLGAKRFANTSSTTRKRTT